MKTAAFILTSALLLVLSGCLIPNENPFYLDDQIVSKPEIVGDWYLNFMDDPADPSVYDLYSVAENEDGDGYVLTLNDMEDHIGIFLLQLAEFDDILIADITPIDLPEYEVARNIVPPELWTLQGHGCYVIKEISEHQIILRCMWLGWDAILADYEYEMLPFEGNVNFGYYKIPTEEFQDIIVKNLDNDDLWFDMALVDKLPGEGSK